MRAVAGNHVVVIKLLMGDYISSCYILFWWFNGRRKFA